MCDCANAYIQDIFGFNLFAVYAVYNDISAEDFLHIQTDTEYRKEWDKSAITLDVIDTDPVHRNKSHIIHWEMQWPVQCDLFFMCLDSLQFKRMQTCLKRKCNNKIERNYFAETIFKSGLCVQSTFFR